MVLEDSEGEIRKNPPEAAIFINPLATSLSFLCLFSTLSGEKGVKKWLPQEDYFLSLLANSFLRKRTFLFDLLVSRREVVCVVRSVLR